MNKLRIVRKLLRLARVMVSNERVRCVFTQSELVQIREELISDGMDGSVVYKKVDAYLDGKTVFELGLRE